MAITTSPYGPYLMGLGTGSFNLSTDTIKVMLVTSSYTPAQATDQYVSVLSAYEVSPTGTGYTTGGVVLSGVTWTYDSVNKRGVLGANPAIFTAVTLSMRYAVVYKWTGAYGTSRLISWSDFGVTKTYAGEDISLSFASGVTRIKAA